MMESCSDSRKAGVVRRRLFVKHERDTSHVSVTSQEKRSSGVFSFFKWFKKSDEQISAGGDTKNVSLPASPNLKRNQSLSCGSLLSTATVSSFSFVNPGKYRQVSLRQIHPGPDTDTYRNRIKQRDHLRELDKDLTLKKKYKLLGGSTTSIYHSVENLTTCARPVAVMRSASLGRKKRKAPQPPLGDMSLLEVKTQRDLYGHRRTVSDSEAREGGRVHVKGKRKAPPPPTPTSSMNNTLSRSWRKKRPAPSLPFNMEEKNRLLHSLEKLKAHAEKQSSLSNSPLLGGRRSVGNDFLKLESGVLKANNEDRPGPSYVPACTSVKDRSVTPSSPVSPRPWYKRNRQPSCGEKSKVKEKDDWLSEGNVQPRKSSVSETDRILALVTQQSPVINDKLNPNHAKSSDSPRLGGTSSTGASARDTQKPVTGVTKSGTSDGSKASSIIHSTLSDGHKQSGSDIEKAVSVTMASASDNQKRSHSFFADGIKHSLSSSSCNSNTSNQSGRNSNTSNHSSRFSFFSKASDDSKRRSQVTLLANISALDREASKIIEREHRRQKALQELENAKYYTDEVAEDHEYSEIVERNINGEKPTNGEGDGNCDRSTNGAVNEEVPEPKRASTRELISLFNAIGNVTRVTVNTAFFSRDGAAHLFSRSDKKFSVNCKPSPSEKRREVFKKIEDFDELEEWNESPRGARRNQAEQKGKLRHGFGEPFKLPGDAVDGSDNEGVTIEELEEERVERPSTSKPESTRGAYKFHRSPSPSIPTILELSEHSSATTPASTLNPASEFSSLASTPLSPQVPSAPSFSNPRQVPHIAQLVWSCPQCTLENLKWKFVCDACNFFRPFSIEMRPKTSVGDVHPHNLNPGHSGQNGRIEDTSILGTTGKTEDTSILRGNLSDTHAGSNGNAEPGFCSRPSVSQATRKAPYYMSDVLKSPDKRVSLADKLNALPTSGIMDPEPCSNSAETKINKASKENESNEVKDREVEELRKARLAFFDKTNREEDNKAESQPSNSSQAAASNSALTSEELATSTKVCDKADLKKIKELLREMKNSIPQSSNSLLNDYAAAESSDHEIKPFVKFENSRAMQKLKSSSVTTNNTSASATRKESSIPSNDVVGNTKESASSSKISNVSTHSNREITTVSSKSVSGNAQVNAKSTAVNGIKPGETTVNASNVNERAINRTKSNGAHLVQPQTNGSNVISSKLNGTKVDPPNNSNVTRPRVSNFNGTSKQEHEGAIKKTNTSSLVVSDTDFDDNSLDRIRIEDDKKAELYLIKSKTILEDILVKKPTSKVSISVQTNSSIVRKTEIQSMNPQRDAYNVSVPVVHEEYRINPDGSLVTSLSKKNKIIGTGTFQLIRSRDFVGIEAAKAGARSLLPNGIPNHTYANVDDESLSTSTCTSSTNCTSQVSPHGQQDGTSNLIRSKCFADFKG